MTAEARKDQLDKDRAVEMLRRGDVVGWNEARAKYPDWMPDLRNENLHRVDMYRANLRRANLEGADLEGEDLCRADLRSANLGGANLRRANLLGANLGGANLRRANLLGANLGGANLRGATLWRANLVGADFLEVDLGNVDLSGADLRSADLRGAKWGDDEPPVIPNIHQAVLEAATATPDALDMSDWHTCDTTHSRAGWVVWLAGEAGMALERWLGTPSAAMAIYFASDPDIAEQGPLPDFYTSKEDAIRDMRRRAGR